MTAEWLAAGATAAWLGVLTSISPCPLATNIAAISFIGRRVGRTRAVLGAGLAYAFGRTAAYVLIAALLVGSLLSAPGVSQALQKYMNQLLGPFLILVGMVLLEMIPVPPGGAAWAARVGQRMERRGLVGAVVLGAVFALAFCPASAALYFGALLPLAVKHESAVWLPTVYGLGTAAPVVAFALVLTFGASALGRTFNLVAVFDRWARRITGVVFILIGVYFILRFVFRVF